MNKAVSYSGQVYPSFLFLIIYPIYKMFNLVHFIEYKIFKVSSYSHYNKMKA